MSGEVSLEEKEYRNGIKIGIMLYISTLSFVFPPYLSYIFLELKTMMMLVETLKNSGIGSLSGMILLALIVIVVVSNMSLFFTRT